MAKKCMVARNKKREKMSERQAAKRAELRKVLKSETAGYEEKMDAMFTLQKMSPNGSRTRVNNRCSLTGRPKGVYRKLKISRLVLRRLAHAGQIPGMRKASW